MESIAPPSGGAEQETKGYKHANCAEPGGAAPPADAATGDARFLVRQVLPAVPLVRSHDAAEDGQRLNQPLAIVRVNHSGGARLDGGEQLFEHRCGACIVQRISLVGRRDGGAAGFKVGVVNF